MLSDTLKSCMTLHPLFKVCPSQYRFGMTHCKLRVELGITEVGGVLALHNRIIIKATCSGTNHFAFSKSAPSSPYDSSLATQLGEAGGS